MQAVCPCGLVRHGIFGTLQTEKTKQGRQIQIMKQSTSKPQQDRVDVVDALRNTGARCNRFFQTGPDVYWLIAPKQADPVVILYRNNRSDTPIKLGTWEDFSARVYPQAEPELKDAIVAAGRWLS